MTAFTIFHLGLGVASPFIGRMVDRYGVRKVISIGALITGLGFALLSRIHSLWYFYGGYTIIGVGMAATSQVPATAMVSNWFRKRRGTAIGIMSTGIGAGGFVLPLLIGGYLIPDFGWRASYLALTLFTWILIPLALLVIKTKPADVGLYPDGVEAAEALTEAKSKALLSPSEGLSLKIALTTLSFWLIAIAFLVNGLSLMGILQSQALHLQDIGFSIVTASTALSAIGLGSLIGKFGFGWLCDQLQAKYACSIGLGLQVVSIVILMNIGPASPLTIIWLYAIIFGLGIGSWLPTMSMLISTSFGLASYGAIFGAVIFAQSVGFATGPLMAGYIYDAMNTYQWVFIIFLTLYAVAIPAILAVRHQKLPYSFKGE